MLFGICSRFGTFQLFQAILQIEGDSVSVIKAAVVLDNLKTTLKAQNEHGFMSIALKSELDKTPFGPKRFSFKKEIKSFYDECDSYITKWTPFLNDFKLFSSTLLVRNPVWNDVSQCFNLLVEQGYMKEELNQQLFNEFVLLNEYLVETNLLAEAERKEKRQWVNIFNDFEEKKIPYKTIGTIVEYCMAIPPSNCASERIFSMVEDYWML